MHPLSQTWMCVTTTCPFSRGVHPTACTSSPFWWRGGGRAAEQCAWISVQRNVFLHTQWLVMGTARTMCNCSLEGGFVTHYGNMQERGDGWWGCCGNVPLQRAFWAVGPTRTGLTLCRSTRSFLLKNEQIKQDRILWKSDLYPPLSGNTCVQFSE